MSSKPSPKPGSSLIHRVQALPALLRPAPVTINARERLRVVAGAALGLGLAALLSQWLAGDGALAGVWLVAPLGATTVLVFAAPAGPMAQPWAAVGGNTVAALVGIACVRIILHRWPWWQPRPLGWRRPRCWRCAACIPPAAR